MHPLLAIGLGAVVGSAGVLRAARPKRALGQLPPVNVAGLGDIRIALAPPSHANFASGVHFIKAAQTFLNRGDLTNAFNNMNAAFRVAGINDQPPGGGARGIQAGINWFLQQYNLQRFGRQTVYRNPPQSIPLPVTPVLPP